MTTTSPTAAKADAPADQAARRPGRPRSEQAEAAILDAVLGLFAEEVSYDDMSMEMIAAAAGVGKATIYRRWPNKEALLIDAIKRRMHPYDAQPPPPGTPVRESLVHLLDAMRVHFQDGKAGGAYTVLIREARANSVLWERYNQEVIEPRRDLFREVLRRGVEAGELRPDLDTERTMIMLISALLFVTRMCPPGAPPVAADYAAGLVDDLLRGAAARPDGG
jgi:AcrR family transcriptional regulator